MKLTLWKRHKWDGTALAEPSRRSHKADREIRVLMVDDEEGFARLTKRNLEAVGGFVVETENRARQAVTTGRAFRPDIILLDVMMPDGDGGELAAKFAKFPDLKDVPILFLTAVIKGSELGNEPGGMIGGRFYIAKPVSTEDLVGYIRANVRSR